MIRSAGFFCIMQVNVTLLSGIFYLLIFQSCHICPAFNYFPWVFFPQGGTSHFSGWRCAVLFNPFGVWFLASRFPIPNSQGGAALTLGCYI